MAILPRLPSELDPLFRLLDDFDAYRSKCPVNYEPARLFTPKFDVRESNDGYHLDGELPGVSQDDIEIQFTDSHTLVIKGRSQRKLINTPDTPQTEGSVNGDSGASTKSLQPTVEDEETENTTAKATTSKPPELVETERQSDSREKYLVSERSTGQFHRTFTFPTRIDQEAVKAKLINGILSIVIPRESAPKAKKIRIE